MSKSEEEKRALEKEIADLKAKLSQYEEIERIMANAKLTDENLKFLNWACTYYRSAIIGVENNYKESNTATEKIKNMEETLSKIISLKDELAGDKKYAEEIELRAKAVIEETKREISKKQQDLAS